MLREMITNVWTRYNRLGEDPKAAFLYAIEFFNAMDRSKRKMLADIVEKHPTVLQEITEQEILEAVKRLVTRSSAKGEFVSCIELDWVKTYVDDFEILLAIEGLIYGSMLRAERRKEYNWALTETVKRDIVISVLADTIVETELGSKRKMQIAKEFGLPATEYERDYLSALLWSREYSTALELGLKDVDDVVIQAIAKNINSGYCRDASRIAEIFLPHRQDVLDELKELGITAES